MALPRCSLGSSRLGVLASAAAGASSATGRSGGIAGARVSPAPCSPGRSSLAAGLPGCAPM
eukprot:14550421-Alexandrium_andersonii.AAC.1